MEFNMNLVWAALAGAVIAGVGLNMVGFTTTPNAANKAAVAAIKAVPACVAKGMKDEVKLAELLEKSSYSQPGQITKNRWHTSTDNETVDKAVVSQCLKELKAASAE